VLLSSAEPEQLASLCRAIDAAFRGPNAAQPRAQQQQQQQQQRVPLAPFNGGGCKRPLGVSPGKAVNTAAGKTPRDSGADAAPRRASAHEHASTSAPAAPPPPPLSASQLRAVTLVASRRNVFITGSAGTGKSFVLRRALEQSPCVRGATFLTAPTGLAACALGGGGMTLNAFAGVGRGEGSPEELLLVRIDARARCVLSAAARFFPSPLTCVRASLLPNAQRVRRSRAAVARWRACSRLVVDEVSMLDARLFEALDHIARALRGRAATSFGGIQLVLCGDFFQLPPVCSGGEGSAAAAAAASGACFAFASDAWREADLAVVELREPHRQTDPVFFRILNAVRMCAGGAPACTHDRCAWPSAH
jgi:ATP-dependent DNA helicase PIF1